MKTLLALILTASTALGATSVFDGLPFTTNFTAADAVLVSVNPGNLTNGYTANLSIPNLQAIIGGGTVTNRFTNLVVGSSATATGHGSFAGGYMAQTTASNTFIWSGDPALGHGNNAAGSFSVFAPGGITLEGPISVSGGANIGTPDGTGSPNNLYASVGVTAPTFSGTATNATHADEADHATTADVAYYTVNITNMIAHATNADIAASVTGTLTNSVYGTNVIGAVSLAGTNTWTGANAFTQTLTAQSNLVVGGSVALSATGNALQLTGGGGYSKNGWLVGYGANVSDGAEGQSYVFRGLTTSPQITHVGPNGLRIKTSGGTNVFVQIDGTLTPTNGVILPALAAPPSLGQAGAMLSSDGTNLVVILQNAGGVRTTNKVTLSAYP